MPSALGIQDVVDEIGRAVLRTNRELGLCEVAMRFSHWNATQTLRCSDVVYQEACEVFGLESADARERFCERFRARMIRHEDESAVCQTGT